MCEHQPGDRGMRLHCPTLRQPNPYLLHVYQRVDEEVHARIGHGGIANGGTYALEILTQQLAYGEIFVGRISPVGLSYLQMHHLSRGFRQSVCQRLDEHPLEVVLQIVVFHLRVHGGGKGSHLVLHAGRERSDKVGEGEIWSGCVSHILLSEHRHARGAHDDVVAVAVGVEHTEDGVRHVARVQHVEHSVCLLPHLVLLGLRLAGKPPGMIEV